MADETTTSAGSNFPGEGWDIQDLEGRPIDKNGNPIVNRALNVVSSPKFWDTRGGLYLSQYNPTLREQLQGWLMDHAKPSFEAQQSAKDLANLVPFISLQDATRNFQAGQYRDALGDLAGAVPITGFGVKGAANVIGSALRESRPAAQALADVRNLHGAVASQVGHEGIFLDDLASFRNAATDQERAAIAQNAFDKARKDLFVDPTGRGGNGRNFAPDANVVRYRTADGQTVIRPANESAPPGAVRENLTADQVKSLMPKEMQDFLPQEAAPAQGASPTASAATVAKAFGAESTQGPAGYGQGAGTPTSVAQSVVTAPRPQPYAPASSTSPATGTASQNPYDLAGYDSSQPSAPVNTGPQGPITTSFAAPSLGDRAAAAPSRGDRAVLTPRRTIPEATESGNQSLLSSILNNLKLQDPYAGKSSQDLAKTAQDMQRSGDEYGANLLTQRLDRGVTSPDQQSSGGDYKRGGTVQKAAGPHKDAALHKALDIIHTMMLRGR